MTALFAKIISFFMAILAFFGLVKPADDKPVVTDYEDCIVEVSEKDEVVVALGANPTTGYTWIYETEKGDAAVTGKYVSSDTTGTIAGAGGTQYFYITPAAPGEYKIVFTYLRTFEKDSELYTHTVEFRVDDAMHVQLPN